MRRVVDAHRATGALFRPVGASAAISVLDDLMRDELTSLLRTVGARRGYLVCWAADDAPNEPTWWVAHGLQPAAIAMVAGRVSRGLTARALVRGEVAEGTSSLCAGLGTNPPRGVAFVETTGGVTATQRSRFGASVGRMMPRLLRALAAAERADPLASLRDRLALDEVHGSSPALVATLEDLAEHAHGDAPVLLAGPTGAGKTHLAMALHGQARGRGAFVWLPMDALTPSTFDDILWGQGSGRRNCLPRARGGTLHLEHFGAHDPAIEARLSAALVDRAPGCRVTASTSRTVRQLRAPGEPVSALRERLLDAVVTVPALADRLDDVPILVRAMMSSMPFASTDVSPGAMRWFRRHGAAENVRGLRIALESAFIRSSATHGTRLQVSHLTSDPQPPTLYDVPRSERPEALARELDDTGWDLDRVARTLDLRRDELYRLIAEYHVLPC